MRAVITVIGKDTVGIIAAVSARCADFNANITEITQSVLKEYFAMIMIVEIKNLNAPFGEFAEAMEKLGEARGLKIIAMHEEIFDAMHRI